MRDRVLKYLKEAGRPVPADQILQAVLSLRSPNALTAAKVLKGILGNDPRFRSKAGLWQSTAVPTEARTSGLTDAGALFIEQANQAGNPLCLRGAFYRGNMCALWEFDLSGPVMPVDIQSLRNARPEMERHPLVTWGTKELRLWNRLLHLWGLKQWVGETLCLRSLVDLILPNTRSNLRPEDLAGELGLAAPDPDQPASMARFLAACLQSLIVHVPEEHRATLAGLRMWIDAGRQTVDFSRFAFGRDFLVHLPEAPGVYVMRNRAGDIIYVGKSRNLKRRVRSYFTTKTRRDSKLVKIHEQLHSLEVIVTASEVEALLLETRLIRDFRPTMNLQAEVHEQAGTYGKEHNLILLVGEPGANRAEAYFLRGGVFVGQQTVSLGRNPSSRFRNKVRSTYFPLRNRKGRRREPWEMEIVSRWLSSNKNRLNFVDVDDAGSYDATLRQLGCYLCDRDILQRKVYYR